MNNINDLIVEINSRRLKYQKPKDTTKYVSAWIEDEVLDNASKPIKALVVVLRTAGCSWASGFLEKHQGTEIGGCTMCGYINDCALSDQRLSGEDIIIQFRSALNKFNNTNFDLLKIFTSGSFLDECEVPAETQASIINLTNEWKIKNLLIESRPEFITQNKLKKIDNQYNGKLQIALGLESSNDKVLKYSINKGFRYSDYITAVKILKNYEILIKTYLLLKPPFLSENDAIHDVINSIEDLNSNELTDSISINPVNIQKFTVIEYLYHRNDYRPPWLWSVVEVLKQGSKIIKETGNNIRLISQPTAGGLKRGAHNCKQCNEKIVQALNDFSLNNNIEILNGLTCECFDTWRDLINLEIFAKSNLV